MKILCVLFLLLQMATFLLATLTFRERGAAKRILYWIEYLTEEKIKALEPSYTTTVAPECTGSRPGKRCSLDELLLHIWGPNAEAGDITAPKSVVRPHKSAKNEIDLNVNELLGRITNAKFNIGKSLIGATDSNKLMPKVGDYYDVLSHMGDPTQKYSALWDSFVSKNPEVDDTEAKPLIKRGRDSVYFVQALRRKDMDKCRVKYFQDYFKDLANKPPAPFEHVMTSVDTEWTRSEIVFDPKDPKKKIKVLVPEKIPVIDFEKTIEHNKALGIADIENRLKTANTKWLNTLKKGQPINANHQKALDAAQSAVIGSECELPFPTHIKKRAVEMGSVGPKAYRSMKVKYRKLGFTP